MLILPLHPNHTCSQMKMAKWLHQSLLHQRGLNWHRRWLFNVKTEFSPGLLGVFNASKQVLERSTQTANPVPPREGWNDNGRWLFNVKTEFSPGLLWVFNVSKQVLECSTQTANPVPPKKGWKSEMQVALSDTSAVLVWFVQRHDLTGNGCGIRWPYSALTLHETKRPISLLYQLHQPREHQSHSCSQHTRHLTLWHLSLDHRVLPSNH